MSIFLVTEAAMRPASAARCCFYCKQPVGTGFHKDDCVLVNRRVVVRLTLDYEIDVPAHWTAADVEFHRNDSSWCASNLVAELQALEKRAEEQHGCMCNFVNFAFVRDVLGAPFLDEG